MAKRPYHIRNQEEKAPNIPERAGPSIIRSISLLPVPRVDKQKGGCESRRYSRGERAVSKFERICTRCDYGANLFNLAKRGYRRRASEEGDRKMETGPGMGRTPSPPWGGAPLIQNLNATLPNPQVLTLGAERSFRGSYRMGCTRNRPGLYTGDASAGRYAR